MVGSVVGGATPYFRRLSQRARANATMLLAVLALTPQVAATSTEGPSIPERRIPEPHKLKHVEPVFPLEARAAGAERDVIFDCVVDPSGRVVVVRPLLSWAKFTEAAEKAVLQWVYAPSPKGAPRRVFAIKVKFRIPAKPVHSASVSELLRQLGTMDWAVRVAAHTELNDRGPSTLPALVGAVMDPNPALRQGAIWTLSSFGPDSRSAVPTLIAAARDPRNWLESFRFTGKMIGEEAGHALVHVDREAAVKALKRAIREADWRICAAVADGFAAQTGEDRGQAPFGLLAAAGEMPECRRYACEALGNTRDARAMSALISLAHDHDPAIRLMALEGLESVVSATEHSTVGHHRVALVRVLREALADTNPRVRETAELILGHLQRHGAPPANDQR